MNRFTIRCTSEQTKNALELGAPLEVCDYNEVNTDRCFLYRKTVSCYRKPTAEEMMGWLREEKNIFFVPKKVGDNNYVLIGDLKHCSTFDTYEEAIITGIDAALKHLITSSKI